MHVSVQYVQITPNTAIIVSLVLLSMIILADGKMTCYE